MSTWKQYSWADLDPAELPWAAQSEVPVNDGARQALRLDKLSTSTDRQNAAALGLDPDHTYYTRLSTPWGSHPAGSRVLLEAHHIAIEQPD
jgi:hypothetical protein